MWCGFDNECGGAPFDPEGILSSVTAVVASLFGAHLGRAVFAFEDAEGNVHAHRLGHWLALSLASLALGVTLDATGAQPLNTDLYSPSFLLVTNGASGVLLAACYAVCDVPALSCSSSSRRSSSSRSTRTEEPGLGRELLAPFRYMGMNSIAIYLLACSGMTQVWAVLYFSARKRINNLPVVLLFVVCCCC